MSKLTNQWVEIFRTGKYPQGEFTAADLDQVVANYQPSNPEFEEAPSTIGHPTGEAPAWAWWEALKREGNLLLGKMKDVQPQFEEMVEKRLFPKRSVGLVKRASGWNLQHVAFLGAKAPAVKGLADCQFGEVSGLVQVEFEESEMAEGNNETLLASLTAWFEEKFGKKTGAAADAAVTFTEADVKRIAGEAVVAAVAEAVKPVQAKLEAAEAKFSERDKVLVTAEIAGRCDAAIAKLKAAGRWVPAFDKAGLPLVFAELAKVAETVEFGEGETKVKKTPLEVLVTFMEQLKKIVPDEAIYTGQSTNSGTAATAPKGINSVRIGVDANSVRFDEAIQAYVSEHKVDYLTAASAVEKAHPELTLPGGASAGAV